MFVLYCVCICLCNMFVLYCVCICLCAHPFDDHSHTTCLMNGDYCIHTNNFTRDGVDPSWSVVINVFFC